MKRITRMLFAAAVSLMLITAQGAMAEAPESSSPPSMPGMTEEQRKAMEDARVALETVEDEVLPQLVESGALSQQDLDEYWAARDGRGSQGFPMGGGRQEDKGAGIPSQREDGGSQNGNPPQGGQPRDRAEAPQGGMRNILDKIDAAKADPNLMAQLQAAYDAYQAALEDAGVNAQKP